MPARSRQTPSTLLVVIAFATVYVVWGSTYFFIKMAVGGGFPPFLLGAIRFFIAGVLLMAWCAIKGEKIFVWQNMVYSAVTGILLLFFANGAVIWSEQTLPSGMVAILVSSTPIWFVLLDKGNWNINLRSKATIIGLLIGFAGVFLLFSEQIGAGGMSSKNLPWMLLLLAGSLAWATGSLYSKYKSTNGSVQVNTAWQMIAAGIVFMPASVIHHEVSGFHWQNLPANSWYALLYLILFGSIAAFSAYVWLLQVRPATQVSTYAYVNPVIAVVLGIVFAGEHISFMQIAGLAVILGSVLLINLAKYRKKRPAKQLVTV